MVMTVWPLVMADQGRAEGEHLLPPGPPAMPVSGSQDWGFNFKSVQRKSGHTEH